MTAAQFAWLVIVTVVIALILAGKERHRIKRRILARFDIGSIVGRNEIHEPIEPLTGSDRQPMTAEERSEAELERLQSLIDERKQLARTTDISYHLWSLYEDHFRNPAPQSSDRYVQNGKWYDVRILDVSTQEGLNTYEFELKGRKYKFVDDEEKQGWREHTRIFSLFLYDDSDRCLIEIPMKMRVEGSGRSYSILSHGPEAFLSGGWVSDFVNVILKRQSLRNQDIRAQKHQERLLEIEDLKDRFGISE